MKRAPFSHHRIECLPYWRQSSPTRRARYVGTACRRSSPVTTAARRGPRSSVAVGVRLIGAFHRHADIVGLLGLKLGELGADLAEVQARHPLGEVVPPA